MRARAAGLLCLSLALSPLVAGGPRVQEFDLEGVVDSYVKSWNESDAATRAELLRRCWADAAVYIDPTTRIVGRDALATHIKGFQSDMRGARIERSSGVDIHHGWLRFRWRIVAADGTELGRGFDVGEIGLDGRLTRIVGFFGDFPAR